MESDARSSRSRRFLAAVAFLAILPGAGSLRANSIASADLEIQGASLRVVDTAVTTGAGIPITIRTEFGGRSNDEAPFLEGVVAAGELTGPGLTAPIQFQTLPGHPFELPPLQLEGVYILQNVRLMRGSEFLQSATPSAAMIVVTNVLGTSVRVRQLTPEEIRARGIVLDGDNFTVYEYTFSFLVNGELVEIPYPVIVDLNNRQPLEVVRESPFLLPPVNAPTPPRWTPPRVIAVELYEAGPPIPPPPGEPPGTARPIRSIPAAIVIPNEFAVLHQFFSVELLVTNHAPAGSGVRLDGIEATLRTPAELRTVATKPQAGSGRPLPLLDSIDGSSLLAAGRQGEAEWTLEGLRAGTHAIEIEITAILRSPGQPDVPLRGIARAAVHIHDPRFNITFSHPATVRAGIEYSTFSFITNLTPVAQTIRVSAGVPSCISNPAANVCLVDEGASTQELTIPSGGMKTIEYRLRSGTTGSIFATAGTVEGGAISAAVALHMGVSASGVPLSPATLVLPFYAGYLDDALISAQLEMLGLAWSAATAPLNQTTAAFPRVTRGDVFRRGQEIAQAGQRLFISQDLLDAYGNLALDYLGNTTELREFDTLRRQEASGRRAGSALLTEMTNAGLSGGGTFESFFDRLAAMNAQRSPFFAAAFHGPAVAAVRPNALSVRGVNTNRILDVPSEAAAGWIRQLPFGDLSAIADETRSRSGELAIIGRWTENLEMRMVSAAGGPQSLEVIYPALEDGSLLRARFEFNAIAGAPYTLLIQRGTQTLQLTGADGVPVSSGVATTVNAAALQIVAARQDLHLDPGGRIVSVLYNRPGAPPSGGLTFDAAVSFSHDGISYQGPRPVFGSRLQDDGRIANVTFAHSLSSNVPDTGGAYLMRSGPLVDPLTAAPSPFSSPVTPEIENDAPAGILFGRVLEATGQPVAGAQVTLTSATTQRDVTNDEGVFFFESVPRDPVGGVSGGYTLSAIANGKSASVTGAVRLPARVHRVDLLFLGRGRAEGVVRYQDGTAVVGARVVVGSTMFSLVRSATTANDGSYAVGDLPVGPLTFSAIDIAGNAVFAAAELRSAGSLLRQDLTIFRNGFARAGTIRGVVLRSDTNAPVSGARVAVFNSGHAVGETFTAGDGRFEFVSVPAGYVTVQAAEWTVSRESVLVSLDLGADQTREIVLTLNVDPAALNAALEGEVFIEDALFPGDVSKYRKAAGAVVSITGGESAVADGEGRFSYSSVPVTFSGRTISALDPATGRIGTSSVPALQPSTANHVPIVIRGTYGTGTVRVRLTSATGVPVSGYRVIDPGFPPVEFSETSPGTYERTAVPAGSTMSVWAVPASPGGPWGDQFAQGTVTVSFAGQIAALNLRLPGEGTVRVKLRSDIDLIGDVTLRYPVWDEAEQGPRQKEVIRSTAEAGVAGFALFSKVPALTDFNASSSHPLHGHASRVGKLGFQGDIAEFTLQLDRLSSVSGVVYGIDGVTPVPGATVRLNDGAQDQGAVITSLDGSFRFLNVGANTSFVVIAETTQELIFRTGIAGGSTPPGGAAIEGLGVVLRRQGRVDGRVVYLGLKTDPANPGQTIPDDTPGELADNAPVPLARFLLKELDFPFRDFGTQVQTRAADSAGRFAVGNVFEGPFRVSGFDPADGELRGDTLSQISVDGETVNVIVAIGTGGTGSIQATVIDPNEGNAAVPFADVTLYREGQPFDLGTTDSSGIVRFDGVPAGQYSVSAYARALGRSGSARGIAVGALTETDVTIRLELSGGVDGRLTDPEAGDAGVAATHVTLDATSFATRTTTGPDGVFAFEGVREGPFRLSVLQPQTGRRASGDGIVTPSTPRPFVPLQLEPTERLHVEVYLPDDSGARSNVLAPLVNTTVRQFCGKSGCLIERNAQSNPVSFGGMLEREDFHIEAEEVGGDRRRIAFSSRFPMGAAGNPVRLVLPAFGEVHVLVTQGGAPLPNARVSVSGGGKSVVVFTAPSGVAVAGGIPLGNFSVQAVTVDGLLSASASGTLASQSTPATITLALGSYAGVTGLVEAEAGGASVGTRVIAAFSGVTLESRTDLNGRYTFNGIPVSAGGTGINLIYIGPDDTTTGGSQQFTVPGSAGASTHEVPPVKLDSTPPRLLSIVPDDGATEIPPDSSITLLFSEPVRADQISNNQFQLIASDGSPQLLCIFSDSILADGTHAITMTPPPPPPGQQFPLLSNMLYRVILSGDLSDRSGHRIPAAYASAFTTSDYIEPRVVEITPPPSLPLQPATTFRLRFSEAIDPAPWQTGGNGELRLYRINAFGESGTILREVPGSVSLDPSRNVLLFGPLEPLEIESFYRIVLSGVKDPQGNALSTQTIHFFSRDTTRPFVTLPALVADGQPLVSGTEYNLVPELRNGAVGGTPATDVAKVDYYRIEGSTPALIFTASAAPFNYRFVAPVVPESGGTLTIRAVATDLSLNVSDPVERSWSVVNNGAPADIVVALTPSGSIHRGKRLSAAVTFTDEGLLVTVQMKVTGTNSDDSAFLTTKSRQLTRATTTDPWPAASFEFDLPLTLKEGSTATVTADVTDVSGQKGTGSSPITVTRDAAAPVITVSSPVADQLFTEGTGAKIPVRATVDDGAGVGVAAVTVSLDGGAPQAMQPDTTPGTWKLDLSVPSMEGVDIVTKSLVVSARDLESNSASSPPVVIRIQPLSDPNAPVVKWTCPTSGGLFPAGHAAKLRVYAIGNSTGNTANGVQKVELFVGDETTPITAAPAPGLADHYEAMYTIPSDAVAGAVFTVRAAVTNVSGLTDEATTSFTIVSGLVITTDTTISATDTTYDNKTLIVRSGTVTIDGDHSLARLIVIDGVVTHVSTTATDIHRLRLEAEDVYVACGGRIDASGRGFFGSSNGYGRTWPNTFTGGSYNGAGGSHGGRGGRNGAANESGATYGSVFDPDTPGGAGAQYSLSVTNLNNSAGGGVVRIRATRVQLDGQILANGVRTQYDGGAGGSVRIDAAEISGGGEIRANGVRGDWAAGGGGRIALYYQTLTVDRAKITAAGAAFQASPDERNGAPGTIYYRHVDVSGAKVADELVVNNLGVQSIQPSTLASVGYRIVDQTGQDFVADVGAVPPFLGPDHLRGIRFVVNDARITTWPIVRNDSETIWVDVSVNPLTATVGDSFRGLYKFDAVTLRNAHVVTKDFFEATSIDKDSVSTLVTGNLAAPTIDPSKISIAPSSGGHTVSGTAGAVADPDPPITVTVLNRRTTQTWTATAAANGSFTIAITGQAGDTIAVKAKDGHSFPMETAFIDVASIAGNGGAPVVDPAKISLSGKTVTAVAGAVTDPNVPITVTLRNDRTGATWTVQAATDGSFTRNVDGESGDAISLVARDSHPEPLDSVRVVIGTLAATNAVTNIDRSTWTSDPTFKPRRVATNGHALAITSYPVSTNDGASGTVVLLDLANPSQPSLLRTRQFPSPVRSVTMGGDWVWFGYEASSSNQSLAGMKIDDGTMTGAFGAFNGHANALALFDETLFVAYGRTVHAFDVRAPQAPQRIRAGSNLGAGNLITAFIPIDHRYLVAINPLKSGAIREDVVVLDWSAKDVITVVTTLDIPDFDAIDASLSGSTLYVVSDTAAEIVAVDLTNPAAPAIIGRERLQSPAGGIASIEEDGFVADTVSGLANIDLTDASVPTVRGYTSLSGSAVDVAIAPTHAYVATENGIAIVPARTAPLIDRARIEVNREGANATVDGRERSVIGLGPITGTIWNTTRSLVVSGVSIAPDGSFSTLIQGESGDEITLEVIDGGGKSAGPVIVGRVPFGRTVTLDTVALAEPNHRARALSIEGHDLLVSDTVWPGFGNRSEMILHFDISDPAEPLFRRSIQALDGIYSTAIRNGNAFLGDATLSTIDLRDPNSALRIPESDLGTEAAFTFVGDFMITSALNSFDGRLRLYDVSNPASPRFVKDQTGFTEGVFSQLIPAAGNLIIGLTPEEWDGNVDVVIFDARDPANLRKLSELSIAGASPLRGAVQGSYLYLAGIEGKLAVVEFSDPSAPVFRGLVDTPGANPHAVVAQGGNLWVADDVAGLTRLNLADPAVPVVVGSQALRGVAWDIVSNGNTLFVAHEFGVTAVSDIPLRPEIHAGLVQISGTADARVTGAPGAVTGTGTLSLQLTNIVTGDVVAGVAAAGGSFVIDMPATPGDELLLQVTDGAGRTAGSSVLGRFHGASAIEVSSAMSDAGFGPRAIAREGETLVVSDANFPFSSGSDKLLVFDASSDDPAYVRTVAVGNGPIAGIAVSGGWAFVADRSLSTVNVGAGAPVFSAPAGPRPESAVSVDGTIAFTGNHDGEIRVWNVADPSQPTLVKSYGGISQLLGRYITQLEPLGTDYLIAFTRQLYFVNQPDRVVILDTRDPNAIVATATLAAGHLVNPRGAVEGSLLYMINHAGPELIVVDLANPATPVIRGRIPLPFSSRRIVIDGTTARLAGGFGGVISVDISNPDAPQVIANEHVAEFVWDIVTAEGSAFVVDGKTLRTLETPPIVTAARISIEALSASLVRVTGTAGSVTGRKPLQVEISNLATSAVVVVPVATDGSFDATITGIAGQILAATATDPASLSSGPVVIGTVPLFAQNLTVRLDRVVLSKSGTDARVAGSAGAVTGTMPVSVVLGNADRATSSAATTVAADGSFEAFIAASPGESITLIGTDASGSAGPFTLGKLPLDPPVNIAMGALTSDVNFRARTLAADGTKLVVASAPDAGTGVSDKLAIFDIANPATPVHQTTVVAGRGAINDVVTHDGWAFAASNQLSAVNLENPSQVAFSDALENVPATAIAIQGTLAFTTHTQGPTTFVRIIVHDIGDPSKPRMISADGRATASGEGTIRITDLLSLDAGFLLALSPDTTPAGGHDVGLIDIRDPNFPERALRIDIPGLSAHRGKLNGRKLYVAGGDERFAIVDFTDLLNPVVSPVFTTAGPARGVDLAGDVAVLAAGRAIETVDTEAIPPRTILSTPSTAAWDVALHHGAMFVANDSSLLVYPSPELPPMIDADRVTVTTAGASANVEGAADAVRGAGPFAASLQIEEKPTLTPVAIDASGGFAGSVAALPGEHVYIQMVDGRNRQTRRHVGTVPFGNETAAYQTRAAEALGDTEYVSRRVAIDGEHLVLSGGWEYNSYRGSDKILLYTLPSAEGSKGVPLFITPNASAPPEYRTALVAGDSWISDLEVHDGWAFATSYYFSAIDLSQPAPAAIFGIAPRLYQNAVAIASPYAFTAFGGSIRIYDVNNPAVPIHLGDQQLIEGIRFDGLLAYGNDHLIAFSDDDQAGVGRDIVIIDRTNLSSLRVRKTFEILNFEAIDGVVDGTTLYVSGDSYTRDAIAIVDISDLDDPRVLSFVDTPGFATGIAVSGPNEIAVADSTSGVTFIDVTDKRNPVILGSQKTAGNAIHLAVSGKTIYVAAEQQLGVITRP